MKKLKGYKLKDEKYREIVENILKGKLINLINGVNFKPESEYYKKLQEVNVLDLFFDKVYEEKKPQVGEWWVTDYQDSLTYITRIDSTRVYGLYIDLEDIEESELEDELYAADLDCLKHKATPEEIEQALTKVCEKNYPHGCKVRSVVTGGKFGINRTRINYYKEDDDSFVLNGVTVYKQGKFAERLEDKITEDKMMVGEWELLQCEGNDCYEVANCKKIELIPGDNIKWLARLLKNYDLDLVKDSDSEFCYQVYLTKDIIKLADKI